MRYKCIVSYDGSNYFGFQIQKNHPSIQGEIQKALKIIYQDDIIIHPAGRTDTGVHAYGQVFHYDANIKMAPWQIKRALNSRIHKDIYIKQVELVSDDFHARYDAKSKIYKYLINLGEYSPLLKNYCYQISDNLDIEAMREAINYIIGEHNFKSFTKNHKLTNTIRTIYTMDIKKEDNFLIFIIHGNGFLHNMIRIIMAMLIEVGKGKFSPQYFKEILVAENRIFAAKTAPANGLYLQEIIY